MSTADNRAVASTLDDLAEAGRCDGPSYEAAFGSIGSRVTAQVFQLLNRAEANLVDTAEVRYQRTDSTVADTVAHRYARNALCGTLPYSRISSRTFFWDEASCLAPF